MIYVMIIGKEAGRLFWAVTRSLPTKTGRYRFL